MAGLPAHVVKGTQSLQPSPGIPSRLGLFLLCSLAVTHEQEAELKGKPTRFLLPLIPCRPPAQGSSWYSCTGQHRHAGYSHVLGDLS